MSLADQASLLLIPTGYKSQKVYSIFPTDGDGDFDFSRSSSATRIAKNGLITTVAANVPRLNYPLIDGVVNGCPSLLLEPQRTNLLEYSEDFTQGWSTSRIESPYIADVLSPDGTLNAYTLEISSGQTNGGGLFKSGISITGDNSLSVFAKKKNANYLILGDTGLTTNAVYFDLENGVVGTTYNATGEIQDFGNGWYRCTMKYTLTSSGLKFIYLSNIDGETINGVQGGDSIYIYGAQLEQGSFPTSYIKSNSGSTTTRNAETCNGAGDATTFNDSEGVLMVEISAFDNTDTSNRFISVLNGTDLLNGFFMFYGGATNRIRYQCNTSSGGVNLFTSDFNSENNNKIVIKYKANDFALWINGFEVGTDTTVSGTPTGLDNLAFNRSGTDNFYGNTKQIQYYNSALTDSELEKISSWTSFTDMATSQLYSIE